MLHEKPRIKSTKSNPECNTSIISINSNRPLIKENNSPLISYKTTEDAENDDVFTANAQISQSHVSSTTVNTPILAQSPVLFPNQFNFNSIYSNSNYSNSNFNNNSNKTEILTSSNPNIQSTQTLMQTPVSMQAQSVLPDSIQNTPHSTPYYASSHHPSFSSPYPFKNGCLTKYTNWAQGYQPRYFILDERRFRLEYYLTKNEAFDHIISARGELMLFGAEIAPDPEHQSGFQITPVDGNIFKLKAGSTKERQEWISELRRVVEEARKNHIPAKNTVKMEENTTASFKDLHGTNLPSIRINDVQKSFLTNSTNSLADSRPDFRRNSDSTQVRDSVTENSLLRAQNDVQTAVFQIEGLFTDLNKDLLNLSAESAEFEETIKLKAYLESLWTKLANQMQIVNFQMISNANFSCAKRISPQKLLIQQNSSTTTRNRPSNPTLKPKSYTSPRKKPKSKKSQFSDKISLQTYDSDSSNINLKTPKTSEKHSRSNSASEKELFKVKRAVNDGIISSMKAIGLEKTEKLPKADRNAKPSVRQTNSNASTRSSASLQKANSLPNYGGVRSLSEFKSSESGKLEESRYETTDTYRMSKGIRKSKCNSESSSKSKIDSKSYKIEEISEIDEIQRNEQNERNEQNGQKRTNTLQNTSQNPTNLSETDYFLDENTFQTRTKYHENAKEDETHRNTVMDVLSSLRLGMDLAQVSFPTYILQPYSLLEFYADMFSHEEMLLNLVNARSERDRFDASAEFLVRAFYGGFGDRPQARKPYNPILGEYR